MPGKHLQRPSGRVDVSSPPQRASPAPLNADLKSAQASHSGVKPIPGTMRNAKAKNIFDSSVSTKQDLRTLDVSQDTVKNLKGRRAVSTLRPGAAGVKDGKQVFESSVGASAVRGARVGADSEVLGSLNGYKEANTLTNPYSSPLVKDAMRNVRIRRASHGEAARSLSRNRFSVAKTEVSSPVK